MHIQFTSSMYSNVTTSTRINILQVYIRTSSFVSLETTFSIACIQQGFVDPKCNRLLVVMAVKTVVFCVRNHCRVLNSVEFSIELGGVNNRLYSVGYQLKLPLYVELFLLLFCVVSLALLSRQWIDNTTHYRAAIEL